MRKALTGISLALSAMAFTVTTQAADFANPQTSFEMVAPTGEMITGDINQFVADTGTSFETLFSLKNSVAESDWRDYFLLSGSHFLNNSGQCRTAVFFVTSGRGYNQVYHHVSQPWNSFGFPPYSDSKTWVRKALVSTMPCDQQAPGIAY